MKSTSSLLARAVLAASVVLASQQLFAEETVDRDKTVAAQQQTQTTEAKAKCHWWQFGKCADNGSESIAGLPPDAPRAATLITVDVATNRIYLWKDGELVDRSLAATGSEKVLKKGSKVWLFHTPRGRLRVLRKIEDPIWTKPDWAFIEDGEPVPPLNSPKRQVKGHLGKYALDLGDGIMIHGTDDASSFGKRASHGCIRVPSDMLETLWQAAKVGTDVYIYESAHAPTSQTASIDGKQPERHSDLD